MQNLKDFVILYAVETVSLCLCIGSMVTVTAALVVVFGPD